MTQDARIVPVFVPPTQPVAPATASTEAGHRQDSKSADEAERAARYRLVIEEGPHTGTFVYKTLDRLTGEVVRQLPREQVVDLMRTADYSAGSVIDTKA